MHLLVCLFCSSFSLLARCQLPPASQASASAQAQSWQTSSAGGADNLQELVQGIAGLMQRFEQLQPQLRSLAEQEFREIATESQQLHERFVELQEKLRAAGPSGKGEETRVSTYHKDLAVFVEKVETRLGATGLRGGGAFSSIPPMAPMPSMPGQMPSANAQASHQTSMLSRGTDQRLATAMREIQDGMQRFEAMHPLLRNVPQQIFTEIATQGQQLHEEFLRTQQQSAYLTQGGRQMSESEAVEYASQLESFITRLTPFVSQAETKVRSAAQGGGAAPGGGGFGYSGMMGDRISPPSQPGSMPGGIGGTAPLGAAGLGNAPAFGAGGGGSFGGASIPPLSSNAFGSVPPPSSSGLSGAFGGGSGAAGDRITPATDKRLSAVIEKVVGLMQQFEAIKPQLSRLPQQSFSQIAQHGQQLDDRFKLLQQRGQAIAGDGSQPMTEQDASQYASDMELFLQDQSAFVDQTKEAIQSGSSFGSTPGAGFGSSSGMLGSASVPGMASAPSPSFGGFGQADSSSFQGGSGGLGSTYGSFGNAGASSFGGSGFGGSSGGAFGSLADNMNGRGYSSGAAGGSFGGSFGGAASGFGGGSIGGASIGGASIGAGSLGSGSLAGSLGSASIRSSASDNDVAKSIQDSLRNLAGVQLDTGVLPPNMARKTGTSSDSMNPSMDVGSRDSKQGEL